MTVDITGCFSEHMEKVDIPGCSHGLEGGCFMSLDLFFSDVIKWRQDEWQVFDAEARDGHDGGKAIKGCAFNLLIADKVSVVRDVECKVTPLHNHSGKINILDIDIFIVD